MQFVQRVYVVKREIYLFLVILTLIFFVFCCGGSVKYFSRYFICKPFYFNGTTRELNP